jgi:hypothetical protein
LHRVPCKGRIYVSAIGNESNVRLEELPREFGCGVILKPLVASGQTSLILETLVGTDEKAIEIAPK